MTKYEKLVQAALSVSHGIPVTDKYKDHGYLEHYAKYLPDQCRSLLEIGVAKGSSAIMWQKFYGLNLDLHVLDLFKDPDHVSIPWVRSKNMVPHEGDQTDLTFLGTIKKEFNVVVEDGSHNSPAQLISFKHHFVNNLVSGGLYCAEDLHCCKDPFYWGDLVTNPYETIIGLFNGWKIHGKVINPYFSSGESQVFENLISRIEVIDQKIAFIWKK